MKKIISTDKAPAAIGPYNQAVDTGDSFLSRARFPFIRPKARSWRRM